MQKALHMALKASRSSEVPVGAVIVKKNKLISQASNQKEKYQQVSKHAEMVAIERACRKLKTWKLEGCELYVSLEPCLMCLGAILESRISKVFFSCHQTDFYKKISTKEILSLMPKKIDISQGFFEEESKKILQDFFKDKRFKK